MTAEDRSQVDNTTALIAEERKNANLYGYFGGDEGQYRKSRKRTDKAIARLAAALEAVTVERDSLSALHEVATERTVQLATVIEKAKAAPYHDIVRDGIRTESVYSVLASAPGDVLREHDAGVWHEGLHAAYNHVSRLEDAEAAGQGVMIPDPINPYRKQGGAEDA